MRYIRLRYYYNYIITSIQPIGNLLTKHCNYIDRFKMSIHAGNYTVQCGLIVSMYRGSLINWITYDTWQVSGVVCLVLFQHVSWLRVYGIRTCTRMQWVVGKHCKKHCQLSMMYWCNSVYIKMYFALVPDHPQSVIFTSLQSSNSA